MSDLSKKPNIVIIGLGYVAEYMVPGYKALVGDNANEHIIGVTTDEKDLERKRAELGFPVYLGENARVLEEGKPDIIVFAPPPSVAQELTEAVLKPYFESLRQGGKTLPDLYALPPSPKANWYYEVLGSDINAVTIVPNMFRTAAGIDISKEGFTLVSFSDNHPWPKENYKRLERFFAPFGSLRAQQTNLVLSTLAGVIATYTMPDAVFAIADTLFDARQDKIFELGKQLHTIHQAVASGADPCPTEQDVLLHALVKSALDGTTRALAERGIAPAEARADQALGLQQQYHITALETRRKIFWGTRKHATKGGVTERAQIFFTQNIRPALQQIFSAGKQVSQENAYAVLEPLYFALVHDVAEHGSRLTAQAEKKDNALEQHAVMLGLLAKYAMEYAGDNGRDAFVAGVKRLGEERGTRMAARAILRGDRLDFVNSQAYGEWRAAPGEMDFQTVSEAGAAISHAPKCAWNDYWRKHGLLEYGKYFCTCIDEAVIKGFNSSLECEVVSNLSWGGNSCEFDWKRPLSKEDEAEIAAKKAELGTSCVRDFNFHIGHVVHSVGGEIIHLLDEDGKDAVDAAVFRFTSIFGRAYTAAFEDAYLQQQTL